MLPTIHIASWEIRTYGLLVSLAVFVIGVYGFHRVRRLEAPIAVIIFVGTLAILGGIGGAWLGGYLAHWEPLHRLGLPTEAEGMSIAWVVLGALCAGLIFCPLFRIRLGESFDRVVTPCALGIAIGRLGCFAAGCCAGIETTAWVGMYLPGEGGVWANRYPTQLWEVAAYLAIFGTLLAVERRTRTHPARWYFDGVLFLLFMALVCCERFALGFVREGTVPVLGPLNGMQLQGIVGLTAVALLLLWNLRWVMVRRTQLA
jgi:phosphatidylglycerol:prolipoprotein diacylglycerol transferase